MVYPILRTFARSLLAHTYHLANTFSNGIDLLPHPCRHLHHRLLHRQDHNSNLGCRSHFRCSQEAWRRQNHAGSISNYLDIDYHCRSPHGISQGERHTMDHRCCQPRPAYLPSECHSHHHHYRHRHQYRCYRSNCSKSHDHHGWIWRCTQVLKRFRMERRRQKHEYVDFATTSKYDKKSRTQISPLSKLYHASTYPLRRRRVENT